MSRRHLATALALALASSRADALDAPPTSERAATRGAVELQKPEAANAPAAPEVGFPPGLEVRAREALERGLKFLAAKQRENTDGSFPQSGAGFHAPIPIAALAALAFMASGSQPERGPYGAEIGRSIDFLLAHADLGEGSRTFGYVAYDGDQLSRMHGHGFATLALTQAYCMSPKTARGERTARVLRAAVDRIEKSQGLEGGWYYEPQVEILHENSVTICLVQALRGAFNAGVQVDSKVIARAVEYVRKCQNPDGSFRYGLDPKEKSTVGLTAASVATLDAMGQYQSQEVERAVQFLWRALEERAESKQVSDAQFPYYERLYVAEALWQHKDARLFQRWAATEVASLLAAQASDGSWSDTQFGPCYATATNCIVLALPLAQLPIFQR